MLLRRITKHVKEQNWFAVLLDFFIVVVGILIAFQITEWSEEQTEARNGKLALEQLHEDFQLILAQTEHSIARHESAIRAGERVISGARTGNYIEASLLDDLSLFWIFSAPSGQSASYAELVASGRLKLIQNETLRSKLKAYDDYVGLVRSDYATFTSSLVQARDEIMRAQTLEITHIPDPLVSSVISVKEVDRDLLSNDPKIHTHMQVAYTVQFNIYAILHRNREEILQLIEMIEEERTV